MAKTKNLIQKKNLENYFYGYYGTPGEICREYKIEGGGKALIKNVENTAHYICDYSRRSSDSFWLREKLIRNYLGIEGFDVYSYDEIRPSYKSERDYTPEEGGGTFTLYAHGVGYRLASAGPLIDVKLYQKNTDLCKKCEFYNLDGAAERLGFKITPELRCKAVEEDRSKSVVVYE